MLIAHEGGLTRYYPRHSPPRVAITEIIADRVYKSPTRVQVPFQQPFVRVGFQGRSLGTQPNRMAYIHRLVGRDSTWQSSDQPRADYADLPEVQYLNLPVGDYTFQVKAVDRDLNYSAPVEVRLTVQPSYARIALGVGFALSLVGLGLAVVYGRRRRQERDQTRASLIQERRRHIEVPPHDIERWTLDDFVETSPAMHSVFSQIRDLQQDDRRALISGEAGTGKELVARAVHAGSARSQGAFVPVRCADLPIDVVQSMTQRTLALSQLFGHAREAFTGANTDRDGWLQQAQGGILFLDEVGLLPLPLQAHLYRVLARGAVRRVGASTEEPFDVRVFAATREDLQAQVELGTFHRGLYEYLAVRRLVIPPLRARQEDIGPLAQRLADEAQAKQGREPVRLDAAVVDRLEGYTFPGNVRELRAWMEQALHASAGGPLGPEHLPSPPQ